VGYNSVAYNSVADSTGLSSFV